MDMLPDNVLFVEHGGTQITDKPHCGDCFTGGAEPEQTVTDTPHCGDCLI